MQFVWQFHQCGTCSPYSAFCYCFSEAHFSNLKTELNVRRLMSKLMEDRMPERKMFLICDARMFQKLLRNNYHRLRFDKWWTFKNTFHIKAWSCVLVFRWGLGGTAVIVRGQRWWIFPCCESFAFGTPKRGSSRTPRACAVVTCVPKVVPPCSTVMISSRTSPDWMVWYNSHDLKETDEVIYKIGVV